MHEFQLPGEYTTRLAEPKHSREHRQTEQDSCWFKDWPIFNGFDVRNWKCYSTFISLIWASGCRCKYKKGLFEPDFLVRKIRSVTEIGAGNQGHCVIMIVCDWFASLCCCCCCFVSVFKDVLLSFCDRFIPPIIVHLFVCLLHLSVVDL